jgi:hypothetical protein
MSIKTKIMNIVTAYPKLLTFGIGLAITFVIGATIGMADHNQAYAIANGNGNGNGTNANR